MKVTEIKPNMLILEYRQDKEDKDYGSCLWARFNFNLDRYELNITSDCGNYGYKWCETPTSESFLKLMTRVGKDYMLTKLYGNADIFDYGATKKNIYEYEVYGDDESKAKLDEIFEYLTMPYGAPESADMFISEFEKANDDCDGWFEEIWDYCCFRYPANALKIVSVFDECIRPKIVEILNEQMKGEAHEDII